MENAKIRELIVFDPHELIWIIKRRVYNRDYLATDKREDIADYIAAKVKGQIQPFLRNARKVRRGNYPRWCEYQELLKNPPGPITLSSGKKLMDKYDYAVLLAEHEALFSAEKERELALTDQLFEYAFAEWATPALMYAFEKADVERSDREIVDYVCKAFYTAYIHHRAESQGLKRVRREGKWQYYTPKVIDEDFSDADVMDVILHANDCRLTVYDTAGKLTQKQRDLLIKLHTYVREDVENLTADEFNAKYPHAWMNYKQVSKELGVKYDSFTKTIQRIKTRIL